MTTGKKWKRFEDLTAQIQRTLAPGISVEQNVRVIGKRSGAAREIDIVLRTRAGQYDLFIAVDCKDYKSRVDVKTVEEFIGLVKDVGANKGAIIASKGFTDAAKNRAREAGIDLYRLVDAQAHEWKTYVTVPVLVEDLNIETFNFRVSGKGPLPLDSDAFNEITLYRADGSPIGVVHDLLLRQWNRQAVPHEPGEHREILLTNEETYVRSPGGLHKFEVRANVKAAETLYFGHLPLVEVQGFADELKGGLITRSIQTGEIDFNVVRREWKVIASRGQLAVRPLFSLGMSTLYPTTDDSD